MQPLPTAVLDLSRGHPVDPATGDAWCDADDPIGEAWHVFVDGNDLEARWRALPARGRFVVGELGLGMGRTLCVLAEAFDRAAPTGATLHVVSVERAPLAAADAARGLAWAGVASDLAGALLAAWPPPVTGVQPVRLRGGRIRALLVLGEAADVLPRLRVPGGVDAWVLDGFAPARDPGAWTPAVLAEVGRRTRPGGSAATWSAAARVREGLAAAGFDVVRRPGHGRKRDMTVARRDDDGAAAAPVPRIAVPSDAVVVGAGLAGSAVAAALADRGVRVTVVDAAAPPPGAASGNPRVIAEPVLGRADTPARRLRWTGWRCLLSEAARDAEAGGDPAPLPGGARCGVLHADAPRWRAIAERLGPGHAVARWIDADEAADRAGIDLGAGGLLVEAAGWLSPRALVARRLAFVRARGGTIVAAEASGAAGGAGGSWRLLGPGGVTVAAATVLVDATGCGLPGTGLPIEAARGQVALVPATDETAGLRLVAGGGAACLPAHGGLHLLASTYDHHDEDPSVRPDDHPRLRERLAEYLPRLAAALAPVPPAGAWAGVRRTTPDRLPLVGPLPGAAGRLVCLAHGSRGVVGGAVAAELLAAGIAGEPSPALGDDAAAFDPARYDRPG